MSSNPALFLLPDSEKYNGSNWLEFKTAILSAARAHGLLPYLLGTLTRPSDTTLPRPSTGWWGSLNPSQEEWDQRDKYTQDMVTLNIKNPVKLGVTMDGTAATTWKSLTDMKDIKNDLAAFNAEKDLNAIQYTEGADLEEHFSNLRTARKKAVEAGSDINETRFRTVVLRSMPDSWGILLASLANTTKVEEVFVQLSMYALFLPKVEPAPKIQPTQAFATHGGGSGRAPRNSELKFTNPNCGKIGHTREQCFRTGGGMEGRFPEWWKGSKTTSTPATKNPGRLQRQTAYSPTSDNGDINDNIERRNQL